MGAGLDLVVKPEFAVNGLLAHRIVAGHGRRGGQRRDVPALDIVYAPETVLVEVSNRSVEQIALYDLTVHVVKMRGHEVMAAREPDDEVRFIKGLIGGFAAAVAPLGAGGTDGVVRVAPGIAGQYGRSAPQTVGVSGQPPAQCEQHRHAPEQQVGSEPPGGVEARPGQQFPVHRAAMHPRPAWVKVQFGGMAWAEVVVVVPRRFLRGAQIQCQERVGFRGQAPPRRLERRRADAPARALQRSRAEQPGLAPGRNE